MTEASTTERTTIELPREEGESNRAYEMRCAYVMMGPGRSIDKLVDRKGIKTGSRSSTYLEWSRKYGWVACARKYDDEMTLIALRDASEQYRRDLEDHRKRYGDMGKKLYDIADDLADAIAAQLHGMKLDQGAITVLAKAIQTAADTEAHALRISDLLPKLDQDGGDNAL